MKILPLVLLVSTLCCAPTGAQTPHETAPLAPVAADAFVWRFVPPVGSRWTVRSFKRTVATIETPSVKIEFNSETGQSGNQPGQPFVDKTTRIERFVADYNVLSRDALGATTIRLTYRTMADNATTKSLSMDLEQRASRIARPDAIDGATLIFKQAPDGTIWNVLGANAFRSRLLRASGKVEEAQLQTVLKALQSQDAARLVEFASLGGALPATSVRVGESWAARASLSDFLPRPLELEGTRTLKSLTPEVATVADSATIAEASRRIPIVPGNARLYVGYDNFTGSVAGTRRIARASGLPLETSLNQKFQGVISTPLTDGEGNIVFVSRVRADINASTRIVLVPRS